MPGAFPDRKPLPTDPVPADGFQRLIEPRQEVLLDLVEFEQGWLILAPQGMALALDGQQDFLANGEVFPQVAGNLLGRAYWAATGAAGGRLVALNWYVWSVVWAFSNHVM